MKPHLITSARPDMISGLGNSTSVSRSQITRSGLVEGADQVLPAAVLMPVLPPRRPHPPSPARWWAPARSRLRATTSRRRNRPGPWLFPPPTATMASDRVNPFVTQNRPAVVETSTFLAFFGVRNLDGDRRVPTRKGPPHLLAGGSQGAGMDHRRHARSRPAARRALVRTIRDRSRPGSSQRLHHDGLVMTPPRPRSRRPPGGLAAIGVHGVVGHGCVDRGVV